MRFHVPTSRGWLNGGIIVILACAVYFLPSGPAPTGNLSVLLAISLLWLVPTLTWHDRIPGRRDLQLLTAAGLTFLCTSLVTLLWHYLPGPVSRTGLIMTMAIFGWLPSWLPRQQPAVLPPRSYRYLWVALLLFTILLRWPNLGYKELQGDEGIVMNRAAAALLGDDNELFLHQKGPIEILLPMMIWQASGAIHDLWLKVPFAIASTLTVFVVASLGSFLWQQPDDQADGKFAQRAGLLAGYLMAICGFSVAFGRIIQYQSWVLFWGCLALLWAAIYQRRQTPLALLLSTFFLAGALLAHYDAVLFLPACAWMLAPPLSIFGT
ncbi:MAG: hypothetical protein KDE59_14050, partial [Anaerolineales bacterium]|nr:hypothetical protein [Anaerolineales bacterium]